MVCTTVSSRQLRLEACWDMGDIGTLLVLLAPPTKATADAEPVLIVFASSSNSLL